MAVHRQRVGAPELYRGYTISVMLMGPDFLVFVGEVELANFYTSPGAAVNAGQRYIEDDIKAREKK